MMPLEELPTIRLARCSRPKYTGAGRLVTICAEPRCRQKASMRCRMARPPMSALG